MTEFALIPPVIALIGWTLLAMLWLFALRIDAIAKGRPPRTAKHARDIDSILPPRTKWVGDNYLHLHEQPTLFYAAALAGQIVGAVSPLAVGLAWGYVAFRVAHTLVQTTTNNVRLRFVVFLASAACLAGLAGLTLAAALRA